MRQFNLIGPLINEYVESKTNKIYKLNLLSPPRANNEIKNKLRTIVKKSLSLNLLFINEP